MLTMGFIPRQTFKRCYMDVTNGQVEFICNFWEKPLSESLRELDVLGKRTGEEFTSFLDRSNNLGFCRL